MNRLKYLRLSHGMKQTELEDASGVRRWKLGLAESGKLQLEKDELEALAQVLCANPDELLRSVDTHGGDERAPIPEEQP
jgi:transcriptional regulator with XRE-family HTH domain